MNHKAAFLGLGNMGFPMAGHLKERAGLDVCAYNRSAGKAQKWQEKYKGRTARTPAEAAEGCAYIFLCVGNDADCREVLTGSAGIINAVKPGAIIVDHTTISAKASQEFYTTFKDRGCHFIDAPVSGGQAGAEAGALTVMAGGDETAWHDVLPIIEKAYAKKTTYIGESGMGQMAKMCNQIAIAGVIQGLSEALNFGMQSNLPMDKVLNAISGGAAQSWQMDNRGETMVAGEFDFGFAIDWIIKDLGIAIDAAESKNIPLPGTEDILKRYVELSSQGFGKIDTSGLIKFLQ